MFNRVSTFHGRQAFSRCFQSGRGYVNAQLLETTATPTAAAATTIARPQTPASDTSKAEVVFPSRICYDYIATKSLSVPPCELNAQLTAMFPNFVGILRESHDSTFHYTLMGRSKEVELLEWFFQNEISKLHPIYLPLTYDENFIFERFFIHNLRRQHKDVVFSLSSRRLGMCGAKAVVNAALQTAQEMRNSLVFETLAVPNDTMRSLLKNSSLQHNNTSVLCKGLHCDSDDMVKINYFGLKDDIAELKNRIFRDEEEEEMLAVNENVRSGEYKQLQRQHQEDYIRPYIQEDVAMTTQESYTHSIPNDSTKPFSIYKCSEILNTMALNFPKVEMKFKAEGAKLTGSREEVVAAADKFQDIASRDSGTMSFLSTQPRHILEEKLSAFPNVEYTFKDKGIDLRGPINDINEARLAVNAETFRIVLVPEAVEALVASRGDRWTKLLNGDLFYPEVKITDRGDKGVWMEGYRGGFVGIVNDIIFNSSVYLHSFAFSHYLQRFHPGVFHDLITGSENCLYVQSTNSVVTTASKDLHAAREKLTNILKNTSYMKYTFDIRTFIPEDFRIQYAQSWRNEGPQKVYDVIVGRNDKDAFLGAIYRPEVFRKICNVLMSEALKDGEKCKTFSFTDECYHDPTYKYYFTHLIGDRLLKKMRVNWTDSTLNVSVSSKLIHYLRGAIHHHFRERLHTIVTRHVIHTLVILDELKSFNNGAFKDKVVVLPNKKLTNVIVGGEKTAVRNALRVIHNTHRGLILRSILHKCVYQVPVDVLDEWAEEFPQVKTIPYKKEATIIYGPAAVLHSYFDKLPLLYKLEPVVLQWYEDNKAELFRTAGFPDRCAIQERMSPSKHMELYFSGSDRASAEKSLEQFLIEKRKLQVKSLKLYYGHLKLWQGRIQMLMKDYVKELSQKENGVWVELSFSVDEVAVKTASNLPDNLAEEYFVKIKQDLSGITHRFLQCRFIGMHSDLVEIIIHMRECFPNIVILYKSTPLTLLFEGSQKEVIAAYNFYQKKKISTWKTKFM